MPPKALHHAQTGTLGILAIDDDQVNLMVMESLLKPQGFEIWPASDGMETYDLLDDGETWPDIVFLDYNLEFGDSGETVLLKLRQRFGSLPIPIVMCTAMSAGSSVLDKCLQMGASDVLLKPYERARVLEMIFKHCGSKGTPALKPSPPPPVAPAPTPAPAPAPAPAPPPPASSGPLEQLCIKLGLEYVGKKLADAGLSLADIKCMDDTALRKAGVVVKSQRDKLLEAVAAL